MSNELDLFWGRIAPSLRKKVGLNDENQADLEANLKKAPKVPLTDEEVDSIVAYATGRVEHLAVHESSDTCGELEEVEELEAELMALNRNRTEDDPEVDEEIERLRKQALNEDDESDDDDKPL